MSFHALVVEDNDEIREEVCDRLFSLGHSCDCASCQSEARDHIQRGQAYAYILLDLEIPTGLGRAPRLTNGKMLLREIRGTPDLADVPIIVMTSHGKDDTSFVIDVMKHGGADDFIQKPFSEHGETLEQAIRETLDKSNRTRPGAKSHSAVQQPEKPPQPFQQGELVYSEHRVELCGVKICGSVSGGAAARIILDALRQRYPNGSYRGYSSDELASMLTDPLATQNTACDAVRRLRNSIVRKMRDQANIDCDRFDIITSDNQGYHFTDKVVVCDADNAPESEADGLSEDPESPDEASSSKYASLNERQQWILMRLDRVGEFRKEDYDDQHFRSGSLKRDVEALRELGYDIIHEGSRRAGSYRFR